MKELIKLNFINLRLSALSKTLSREEAAKPQTKFLRIIYPTKDNYPKYTENS